MVKSRLHLSSSVLFGIYGYSKITSCLSETLLGPQTTQKIPPPSQMLIEFFEMIRREKCRKTSAATLLHLKLWTTEQICPEESCPHIPKTLDSSPKPKAAAWGRTALNFLWLGIDLIFSVVINFPNCEMTPTQ